MLLQILINLRQGLKIANEFSDFFINIDRAMTQSPIFNRLITNGSPISTSAYQCEFKELLQTAKQNYKILQTSSALRYLTKMFKNCSGIRSESLPYLPFRNHGFCIRGIYPTKKELILYVICVGLNKRSSP